MRVTTCSRLSQGGIACSKERGRYYNLKNKVSTGLRQPGVQFLAHSVANIAETDIWNGKCLFCISRSRPAEALYAVNSKSLGEPGAARELNKHLHFLV